MQQLVEKCKWQAFKKAHSLISKHDGIKLAIEHIHQLLDDGEHNSLVHDDYGMILHHLSKHIDIDDDNDDGVLELRQFFSNIAAVYF